MGCCVYLMHEKCKNLLNISDRDKILAIREVIHILHLVRFKKSYLVHTLKGHQKKLY
jgi:hypothetical protein